MSTYRLDRLFSPRSVAVIGASARTGSVGHAVFRNLRDAGFGQPVFPVNPHRAEIDGTKPYARLQDLPKVPDLIVVATPADTVADLISQAGQLGVPAAIVLTAGLGHGPGSTSAAIETSVRATGLRVIGPNCLGVIVPRIGLNASFAAAMPPPGDLALISQSGGVAAGLAQWANGRGIGFSAIVSFGDSADVDISDLLDYFALDPATRSILLYVESIRDARKFMSAARAAARAKPVIVVKSGRHAQGAKAAATHTGALAGSDAVYDAAFRRAGLLRVLDLDTLFAAAEMLAYARGQPGNRLAILTNGGGLGVLAVDRLIDAGGTLATLSPATLERLDRMLPPTWSKANPVDIIGDADSARYANALEALLQDPGNDAILAMQVPTALASAVDCATGVIEATSKVRKDSFPAKPVLAVWVGTESAVAPAFEAAQIPYFDTEVAAVEGFMHIVRYREVQEALLETPPAMPERPEPDVAKARAIVREALAAGTTWLDPIATAGLLAVYQIPMTPVALAKNAEEAAAAARPWISQGQSVVVKILSPDIVHKSDIGGVRLNLTAEAAVRDAAADILARAAKLRPQAKITGVTVHPMIVRPKARELIAGIADDATFGPIIAFGAGGTAVEVLDDKALTLPPLDLKIAHGLISRTRISRVLNAYRDSPAADIDGVAQVLVMLSRMIADIPEIREVDLNPLLADETGVIAVDARIAIGPLQRLYIGPFHPRFAIQPYPKEWERHLALGDATPIFVRPVRAEDETIFRDFFAKVSAEDLRLRFFGAVKDFSHAFIARLTQLDYARAMALVAIEEKTGELLGVVRLHADANYERGEYAILVRSDLKGRGLGWQLMQLIIAYARWLGLRTIEGQVLRENQTMLTMCRELGFSVASDPADGATMLASFDLAVGAQMVSA